MSYIYTYDENNDENYHLNNSILINNPLQQECCSFIENKEEIVNEDIDETKLYFKKKNEEIIHNHLDEETTSYQIKRKNLEFNSSQGQDENKEQNNDQNVCNLEKIKEILNKNVGSNTYIEITKNISNDDKHTKNAIDNLLKKKRPRKSDEEFEILKNEYNKKKTINKRGRQIKNKRYTGCHNKYSGDNMIKKVKGYSFDYCLIFINNMLCKYKEGNRGALLKLDYKIKDSINQKKDLNILKMPLKDLFSNEITPKIKSKKEEKDFNKKKLEKILNEETDDTIIFILNMRFIDWFDVFTFKKTLEEVVNQYNINNKYIDLDKIKKNFITIDELLKKKSEKDSDEYTLFLFYIYNYETWFKNKKPRNKNISKII